MIAASGEETLRKTNKNKKSTIQMYEGEDTELEPSMEIMHVFNSSSHNASKNHAYGQSSNNLQGADTFDTGKIEHSLQSICDRFTELESKLERESKKVGKLPSTEDRQLH